MTTMPFSFGHKLEGRGENDKENPVACPRLQASMGLPRLSREEIQTMLQVHDIRESRVYQEAREEGLKEGMEQGIEKGISMAIAKMASKKMSAAEIAAILELDVELVRKALANANGN